MLRKLCLLSACWFALFFSSYALAITGNSCTVSVSGLSGSPVLVLTSCTTIANQVNPNINFISGTPMPTGMLITKSSSSGGNATWQISGTPTDVGTGSATYTFTDTNPGSVSLTVNYAITGPVAPSATFVAGTAGRPYPTATVTATGGTGSGYTYTVGSGNLPTGLSLSSGGSVSGTTTASGTFNFSITATDSGSNVGSGNFSITVNPAVSTTPTGTINRTVSQIYNSTYSSTGGTAPTTRSVSAGTLPPGASFNPTTGVLSGTANAAGTGTFTVTSTDTNGSSADTTVTYTISPTPGLSMATPTGVVGSLYSQAITFTGAANTATLSTGTLPPGLALTSGGTVLSGTPSQSGTFAFTLGTVDSNTVSTTASFSVTIVAPPSVTTSSLADGTVGSSYTATVASTGGIAPVTLQVSSGTMPPGLAMSAGGSITGTPTLAGTFTFTVSATDSMSNSGSRQLSITIQSVPVTISTTSLPQGTIGTSYNATVIATGGAGPLQFTLASGTLPTGLTLAASGAISGTPTALGSYTFTVQAADAFLQSASQQLSITIQSVPITISTTSLPQGAIGVSYNGAVLATGGSGPLQFTLTSGALPPGLSLAANGAISGTPTTPGNSTFSVQVADSFLQSASRQFSIQVVSPIQITTNPSLSPTTVGADVHVNFQSTGGTAPLTWTLTGTIPPGLYFNNGLLWGAPTQPGFYSFTVQVQDAFSGTASVVVTLQVNGQLTILNSNLGGPYSRNGHMLVDLRASGGTLPLTWSIALGALPPGVIFNGTTGRISGNFYSLGSFPVTIRLMDAAGVTVTRAFNVSVTDGPQFARPSLPGATVGMPYKTLVETVSTVPVVYWQIATPDTFPPGLQWIDREIVGTPTVVGAWEFELNIRDSGGSSAVQAYVFTVNPVVELDDVKLQPEVVPGKAFAWLVPRRGGTAPFRYDLLAGTLPPGLKLNAATGEISGTTQNSGEYGFTIGVTDANESHARRLYQLRPSQGFQIRTDRLPGVLVPNRLVRLPVEVEGGMPPFKFEVAGGMLPPGLAWNGSVIEGQPSAIGAYEVYLSAVDQSGQRVTRLWSVHVADGLEVQPSKLSLTVISDAQVGIPYTLKWASAPATGTVRIYSQVPWLRVGQATAGIPGTVDVWVEPALLAAGKSSTELIFQAGSTTSRIPVAVDKLDANPAKWWVETTPTPGGGWAALLQGEAAQIPFQARLDSSPNSLAGNGPLVTNNFRLNGPRGEIAGPDAYLLWLERQASQVPTGPDAALSLAVQNLRTGQEQIVSLPVYDPPAIESSIPIVLLNGQLGAAKSSNFTVSFRSNRGAKIAVAALADVPWLESTPVSLTLATGYALRFTARLADLSVGVHTGEVKLYNQSGDWFETLPVQLTVSQVRPAVELSTQSMSLTRQKPSQTLRLYNPGATTVAYAVTSRTASLRVDNGLGEIPAGGEVTVPVSAATTALGFWSRQQLLVSLGGAVLELVEVDLGLATSTAGACPAASPVISFLSPGPGFVARVDQPMQFRVQVRDGCGTPIPGSVLTLRIPGNAPVALSPGPDGIWYGTWIPVAPADSLQIEAVWLNSASSGSLSRYWSGQVKP